MGTNLSYFPSKNGSYHKLKHTHTHTENTYSPSGIVQIRTICFIPFYISILSGKLTLFRSLLLSRWDG